LGEQQTCQILKFPRNLRPRTAASTSIASVLPYISKWRLETQDKLRETVILLELTNRQNRQLIGCVDDAKSRERLLAQNSVIANALDIARHKISRL
jgi:hypothetical protein